MIAAGRVAMRREPGFVAAAVLTVFLAGACSSSPKSHPPYQGQRWRLTAVTAGGTPVRVPSGWDAWAEFSPGGCFLLDDGVNALGGRYTPGANGFTTSEGGSTLAGYLGGEPGSTLIAAMGEVAFGPFVNGSTSPRPTTGARLVGGSLELTTPGYRLTLAPAGTAQQVQDPLTSGPAAGQCAG